MCTRNPAHEKPPLLPVTENKTRPQGGFVIHLSQDSTTATFQSQEQTQGTNPAAASSWEQPKVPQPSTHHTFPTDGNTSCRHEPTLWLQNIPSPPFSSTTTAFHWILLSPRSILQALSKTSCTCPVQPNSWCPHPITNTPRFCFTLSKTPFSLLK